MEKHFISFFVNIQFTFEVAPKKGTYKMSFFFYLNDKDTLCIDFNSLKLNYLVF